MLDTSKKTGLDTADLGDIAARSLFLHERAGLLDHAEYEQEPCSSSDTEKGVAAWERALCPRESRAEVRKERLKSRLAVDGLSVEDLPRLLGRWKATEHLDLPSWTDMLRDLPPACEAPEGEEIPFWPIISILAEKTLQQIRGSRGWPLLSNPARIRLQRLMANQLLEKIWQPLLTDFRAWSAARGWGRNAQAEDLENYDSFIRRNCEDKLHQFFIEYPVAARAVGLAMEGTARNVRELLDRLKDERQELQEKLKIDVSPGSIDRLVCGLSDPHNSHRSVCQLDDVHGASIIYKPRGIGHELDLQKILELMTAADPSLDFKIMSVIDRETHGWVEFVRWVELDSESEVEAYYRCAGALLALSHGIFAVDLHAENICACGRPTIIDAETICTTPREMNVDKDDSFSAAFAASNTVGRNSVLRCHLLPLWVLDQKNHQAEDWGGLGTSSLVEDPPVDQDSPGWVHINTDAMDRPELKGTALPRFNQVVCDGRQRQVMDYTETLQDGFRRGVDILSSHPGFVDPDGPVATLLKRPWRALLRDTATYVKVREAMLHATRAGNACRASWVLEGICQSVFGSRTGEPDLDLFPLVKSEMRRVAHGDIPIFSGNPGSKDLWDDQSAVLANHFEDRPENPQDLLAHLSDPEDTESQISIIRTSLVLSGQREIVTDDDPTVFVGDTFPNNHREDRKENHALEAAMGIAETLHSSAITGGNSASWLSVNSDGYSGARWFSPVNMDLYTGTAGIGTFFAAAARVGNRPEYATFSQGVLDHVQRCMSLEGMLSRIERKGLGTGGGVSGIAWSLAVSGQLLGRSDYWETAREMLRTVNQGMIESDIDPDVLYGSAGLLLLVSRMISFEDDEQLRRIGRACVKQILASMRNEGPGNSWSILGHRFGGISHGSAGFALALDQWNRIEPDEKITAVIEQCHAFEDSLWEPEEKNWCMGLHTDTESRLQCWMSWCHGPPGIALTRCDRIINGSKDNPRITEDLIRALESNASAPPSNIDHHCCGNAGRIEALLLGGRALKNQQWIDSAHDLAAWMIDRAAETGHYSTINDGLPARPGMGNGLAGIGWVLSQLADPNLVPSLGLYQLPEQSP